MQQSPKSRPGRGKTVLVLQGGGALGAYQAGAYEALAENGIEPQWVAGISIGAINGTIIAGNRPEHRVERLRTFWRRVSSGLQGIPLTGDGRHRAAFNETSAFLSLISGVPGFFEPRLPPPIFTASPGTQALGYYTTEPLISTLTELVDFDYLRNEGPRLSVGAVNIRSGNFAYFDRDKIALGPQHIMASGALPPGLPPVEIDGEFYWDGGLVSNTPLQYVLDEPAPADEMCIFQVDLFSARGTLPETLLDAVEREKEIRYSSRTRLNTDMMRDRNELRSALRRLLHKLPKNLRDDADAQRLMQIKDDPSVTIVQLIYRERAYETHARDYEFSRVSVEEHWDQGRKDVIETLRHESWRNRDKAKEGVKIVDLTRNGKGSEHARRRS